MIISFINNKGGVLKTTLATNVAGAITKINQRARVIIVDLDGQGNVSATFGQHPGRLTNTLIDVLRKETTLENSIINQLPGLDLLPCNQELGFVDLDVSKGEYKASDIKDILKNLEKRYDFVIVDTPPAMSTIVSVVMSVSKIIVIPFEPDQYSMLGLMRIVEAMGQFKERNPELTGIVVPTKFVARTRLHQDVLDIVRKKLQAWKVALSKYTISYTTKAASAVGYEKIPAVLMSKKSKLQQECLDITREILKMAENKAK